MNLDQSSEKYDKLTNTQVLERYHDLVMNSKENSIEKSLELGAILKIVHERGLDITKHLQKKQKTTTKKEVKKIMKNYNKDALKLLLVGIGISLGGIALTAATAGNFLFYGALIMGGLFILTGLGMLIMGVFLPFLASRKSKRKY